MSTLTILGLFLVLSAAAALFVIVASLIGDLIRHSTTDRYPTEWEDEDGND